MGISLGKANYCINALIEKGMVKTDNFRRNPHKGVYAYLLTPEGVQEKARVTVCFLRRKMAEYDTLPGGNRRPAPGSGRLQCGGIWPCFVMMYTSTATH